MKQMTELLCELIRDEVCGAPAKCRDMLTENEAKQLYILAKSHDLVHLLCAPIERCGISPSKEVLEKFRSQTFSAVYRQNNISHEMTRICDTLERACIPFIPLKGAIVRELYPKPWMRTSCDVDILIRSEDLEKAADAIIETLSYERKWKNSHEVSFFSKNGVHLELHYRLVGDESRTGLNSVLDTLWESIEPKAGKLYELLLADEMFYFYHVAHMALHFENGGCGMRPFLDMWLLNHNKSYDKAAREALLHRGGLLKFAVGAEALCEVWFGTSEHTSLTHAIEDYLVGAGVYGSESNSVMLKQTQKGSSFKYILSRLWLPYDSPECPSAFPAECGCH